MGFSVDVDALPLLSAQLHRAAEASRQAKTHLQTCDTSALGGFVSAIVKPNFDEALTRQLWFLGHGAELTDSATSAVDRSREYYAKTDADSARQFDGKLPASGVEKVPVDTPAGHAAFADIALPQARLREPGDYSAELTWAPSIESDLGNLVSIVRWGCEELFGLDPFEMIMGRMLAGNWREFRRNADRFNNVAWACKDIADNLASAVEDGETDWTGNAASAAFAYVVALEKAFRGTYQQNEYLAGKFTEYAEGSFKLFDGLASVVSGWINGKVIPALASIGIAAATEEIPVLDIATDAWAAWTIWDVVEAAYSLYELYNKWVDLTKVFAGSISLASSAFYDVVNSAQSLPQQLCVASV